jgi:hypothetical protein
MNYMFFAFMRTSDLSNAVAAGTYVNVDRYHHQLLRRNLGHGNGFVVIEGSGLALYDFIIWRLIWDLKVGIFVTSCLCCYVLKHHRDSYDHLQQKRTCWYIADDELCTFADSN